MVEKGIIDWTPEEQEAAIERAKKRGKEMLKKIDELEKNAARRPQEIKELWERDTDG